MSERRAGGETVEQCEEQLRRLLIDLGRDDVGVGEVVAAGDVLRFMLTRGEHARAAAMAIHVLDDVERAKAVLTGLLVPLSKTIERDHLQAAGTSARPSPDERAAQGGWFDHERRS